MSTRRGVPILVLALGLLALPASDADSFQLWGYEWSAARATIYADSSLWLPSDLPAIQSRCSAWSNLPGSRFVFGYQTVSNYPGFGTANGRCEIYPGNPGPGVLGFTYLVGTSGSYFQEVDIEIDITLFGDKFAYVVLHELGHGLGLDHEDSVPSIMNTFYVGGPGKLYADDIDGVATLYPLPPPTPPEPEADIAVTSVTHAPSARLGRDVTVSWSFQNQGDLTSSNFEAVVYLDGEKTPGPATGTEMGRVPVAGLGPDQSKSGLLTVRMPDELLPGTWFLGVRAEGVVNDRNVTNNAAAPTRPLEIVRDPMDVGPRDRANGTLGPYGHDRYRLDLPLGIKMKAKAKVTRPEGSKSDRQVSALLGLHRPGIPIPFRWDFGKKPSIKPVTIDAGEHEVRITNDLAVPLTYRLRIKVSDQKLSGLIQTGRSVAFRAWAGGSAKITLKSAFTNPTMVLVDPDGFTMDVTDRIKVKSGGRKLKLKLKELTKSGEYELAVDGTPSGYVDWWVNVTVPAAGITHERD